MKVKLFPAGIFDVCSLLAVSIASYVGANLYMLNNQVRYYRSIGKKIDAEVYLSIMLCHEKSDFVFFCEILIRFFTYMILARFLSIANKSRRHFFICMCCFLFVLFTDIMIDWIVLRLEK